MSISKGSHYNTMLRGETSLNTPVNDVTIKPYGFYIRRITTYVSIYTTRLEVYSNGTAKAVTKVDKNYQPKHQYTTYFDQNGLEIVDKYNSTRAELAYFKKIK